MIIVDKNGRVVYRSNSLLKAQQRLDVLIENISWSVGRKRAESEYNMVTEG